MAYGKPASRMGLATRTIFRRCAGPSMIHGNPKRGVGVLNNELYVGHLVWNRLR